MPRVVVVTVTSAVTSAVTTAPTGAAGALAVTTAAPGAVGGSAGLVAVGLLAAVGIGLAAHASGRQARLVMEPDGRIVLQAHVYDPAEVNPLVGFTDRQWGTLVITRDGLQWTPLGGVGWTVPIEAVTITAVHRRGLVRPSLDVEIPVRGAQRLVVSDVKINRFVTRNDLRMAREGRIAVRVADVLVARGATRGVQA